jgi:hypothetical protein
MLASKHPVTNRVPNFAGRAAPKILDSSCQFHLLAITSATHPGRLALAGEHVRSLASRPGTHVRYWA